MFEHFKAKPNDPILQLSVMYKNDPNPEKIDVGVGVFKNEKGETPILASVAKAEQIVISEQTTKAYVGVSGNAAFNTAMTDLVFADAVDKCRIKAVQATAGSGALRISAHAIAKALPNKTIWLSEPTWGNHAPIFGAADLTINTYPYFDYETKKVDEFAFLNALSALGKDDVVLLHGCCHNPTGADLSLGAWEEVGRLANEKGFLPFIDLAYQGFGKGLDEDLAGVRKLASMVPNLIITSSCSKNFGAYRDRVGCVMILGETEAQANAVASHIAAAGRVTYSMPPDHGAAVVAKILNDDGLRKLWEEELKAMRDRINTLRHLLSNKMADLTQTNQWNFINEHQGMFSLLCLSKEQTDALINNHSIYIVGGGRTNIAGLRNEASVNRFAECLHQVTKK